MTIIRKMSMSLAMLFLSLILITPASAYPYATANGPYVGYYGMDYLLLSGTGTTSDNTSTITGYEWKVLNTGSILSTGSQPMVPWDTISLSISPNTALPYIMPLLFTVTDSLGQFDNDYTTFTIYDRRPFAMTNWYGDLYLRESLILDGSESYHGMPGHTIQLYGWQVVGTSLSWSSQDPTVTLAFNEYKQFLSQDPVTGLYNEPELKLTVTDDLGQTNSRTFVIKPAIPTPVPEPATMLLLGAGLIGLAGFKRKFKQ